MGSVFFLFYRYILLKLTICNNEIYPGTLGESDGVSGEEEKHM